MSQAVNVCVLFGFGINCDRETAAVFEMVGATSERLHVNRLCLLYTSDAADE